MCCYCWINLFSYLQLCLTLPGNFKYFDRASAAKHWLIYVPALTFVNRVYLVFLLWVQYHITLPTVTVWQLRLLWFFFDMHLNLTPLRCLLLFFHSTNPARHSIFSPSFNFNLSNWLMSQITEKTSDTVSVQVW